MRPALALLIAALSVIAADAVAVERLSDEVRAGGFLGRSLSLSGRGNEAVVALLESADRELGAGHPDQASLALERALRIDPRNPTVWHYLGLARLDAGDFAQAEAMASRSQSLAPDDWALRTRNARLVTTARRASGQAAAPLPDGFDDPAPREEVYEQRRASVLPQYDVQIAPPFNSFDVQIAPRASYTDSRERPSRSEQRVRRAPLDKGGRAELDTPVYRARPDDGVERAQREQREFPPARECRYWYPNRPSSRQPPPFTCDQATGKAPPGAVLLMSI
jgi:tetratricopeptide (TPR) repeat protein